MLLREGGPQDLGSMYIAIAAAHASDKLQQAISEKQYVCRLLQHLRCLGNPCLFLASTTVDIRRLCFLGIFFWVFFLSGGSIGTVQV